jgi:hypothetical protein
MDCDEAAAGADIALKYIARGVVVESLVVGAILF